MMHNIQETTACSEKMKLSDLPTINIMLIHKKARQNDGPKSRDNIQNNSVNSLINNPIKLLFHTYFLRLAITSPSVDNNKKPKLPPPLSVFLTLTETVAG